VLKVIGDKAFVQVFESTRGLKVGNNVEFMGHMLEVTLGPGLLSRNYDGLQNDLDKLTGVFLQRGEYNYPLDTEKLWDFKPIAKAGDKVEAGLWLGEVDENHQPHKIMVPFKLEGTFTVKSIVPEGEHKILDVIAVLLDSEGKEIEVTMVQKWPVKKPSRFIPKNHVRSNCLKQAFAPLILPIRLLKVEQDLYQDLSEQEKLFCNMLFRNKPKPIS